MDAETKYLNRIIRGKIQFRKCPSCDLEGKELIAYDENDLPCSPDQEGSIRYFCEDCRGLGFIELPFAD